MRKAIRMLGVPTLAAVGLLAFSGGASAVPITCNVANASANGSIADACAGDDAIGANPVAETGFVNGAFGGGFTFVDKTGDASLVPGFVLNVTTDSTPDPYAFLYTLTVPTQWLGAVVDWVLVIKQASNSTIAYVWNDVTLGIDGGYNSFWLNPKGKEVNAFSHASGLIRPSTTKVPEPGTLLLTGLGLVTLGFARLRKRRAS